MELIERVDISLVKQLNNLSFINFEINYMKFSDDIEKVKKKDLKSLYEKIKSFCQSNIKSNGITKRLYQYSLGTIKEKGGRLYCGSSIQGMPKFIRGFLMKNTTDIDAKNCHPKILRYLCRIHNIDCQKLDFYVENREVIIKMGLATKDDYLKSTNDSKINKNIQDSFFKEFDKEMKQIQKNICDLDQYSDIVISVPNEKKEYNWNGSALNRILCMYENNILQVVIKTLNELEIEIAVLMFDGLMIYGNYYKDLILLEKITNTVEEKFKGLNMEWTYKNHCDKLKIENLKKESDDEIDINFFQISLRKL